MKKRIIYRFLKDYANKAVGEIAVLDPAVANDLLRLGIIQLDSEIEIEKKPKRRRK